MKVTGIELLQKYNNNEITRETQIMCGDMLYCLKDIIDDLPIDEILDSNYKTN